MAATKAQIEASKRYMQKNKDKFSTFSLRVKLEEKDIITKRAAAAGKSITQYLMECAGIR